MDSWGSMEEVGGRNCEFRWTMLPWTELGPLWAGQTYQGSPHCTALQVGELGLEFLCHNGQSKVLMSDQMRMLKNRFDSCIFRN